MTHYPLKLQLNPVLITSKVTLLTKLAHLIFSIQSLLCYFSLRIWVLISSLKGTTVRGYLHQASFCLDVFISTEWVMLQAQQ